MSTSPRVAKPTAISVARVADPASKRLGYRWVGICENDTKVVIIRNDEVNAPEPIWRHRDDMSRFCPAREVEGLLVTGGAV